MPMLERAFKVLPHMSTYMKAVEENTCPNPGTKSFEVIQEAIKDPLMTAKMNFILSVIKEVTPFLTCYQHMVPFLSTDLFKLLKSLMSRFIKPDSSRKKRRPLKSVLVSR